MMPTSRGLVGRDRCRHRAARAHRPSAAWPATSRPRSSARAAPSGHGQGDLRHGRDARPVHRPGAGPRRGRPGRRGHVPHRRLPGRREGHLGHRGRHALGRHLRRVAPRRPRDPGQLRRVRAVAARCETSGDVWFVPALLGLGTPVWDFGARGTLVGLTRGSGRPEIVRAVLEGVAHRGADLVEASETRQRLPDRLAPHRRRDVGERGVRRGLADAIGRPVEVSPVIEATTLGAGLLAGLAVGTYASTDELADTFSPRRTVEPRIGDADRAAARGALARRPVQGRGHHSRALGHLLLSGITPLRRRPLPPERPSPWVRLTYLAACRGYAGVGEPRSPGRSRAAEPPGRSSTPGTGAHR